MIIQCEQCQTRFRLDDSKVTAKGVKVRCAKCKYVFSVRKEQTAPETTDLSPTLEQPVVAIQHTDAVKVPLYEAQDNKTVMPTPAEAELTRQEESPGLDFCDSDMFGVIVPPTSEALSDSVPFDFGTGSFTDSVDTGDSDSGQKDSSTSQKSTGEESLGLGEVDFGDELTAVVVQQFNTDENNSSKEILFAPLAETAEKTAAETAQLKNDFSVNVMADKEGLPPLLITSRRKQSPLFNALIVAVVLLLIVGVLGYFGISTFNSEKGTVSQEAGKISLRALKAVFVQNTTIGTLLVISGEALNEYSKPRAALQVKGTIFDANGKVLATKTAYCGNPLTKEILGGLSLDKIEAAMSNQFGDSLANLDVAAGKSVPFTIVIANPAREGKDFAVEPAGSIAATGKQR